MIDESPPSFQGYPGLSIIAITLLAFGSILMLAGILIGLIMVTNEKQNAQLTGGILSAAGIILGFFMVVMGEGIRLLIDLQENADRQSIALHGIFHLLMKEADDVHSDQKAN